MLAPRSAASSLRGRDGRIVLTNVSRRPFRFARCPVYLQELAPYGRHELLVLNCLPMGTLRASGHAVFEMVLRVPPRAVRGANGLLWELGPRTYEPPSAAAQVLVR